MSINSEYSYWYFKGALSEKFCDDVIARGKEEKEKLNSLQVLRLLRPLIKRPGGVCENLPIKGRKGRALQGGTTLTPGLELFKMVFYPQRIHTYPFFLLKLLSFCINLPRSRKHLLKNLVHLLVKV